MKIEHKPKYALGDKVMCVEDGRIVHGTVVAVSIVKDVPYDSRCRYGYEVCDGVGIATADEDCVCLEGGALPEDALRRQMEIVRTNIQIEETRHKAVMEQLTGRLRRLEEEKQDRHED